MQDFPTKVDGVSTEPAAEYNNLASELKETVESLGLTLSVGSIQQLTESIATYAQIGTYYTDGGTADTYVLSAAPATRIDPSVYYAGMTINFLPANTNTGASTANLAGLGAKAIVLQDGSTALSGGELVANEFVKMVYDGTSFRIETEVSVAPAYDSGWFSVVATTEYTKAHGLGQIPSNFKIFWSLNGGADNAICADIYSDYSSAAQRGCASYADATNIKTRTITHLTNYNHYDTSTGTYTASNVTTGYFKILAWI